MADDPTKPTLGTTGDASNSPVPPTPAPTPEPEARILEETIISPAPSGPLSSAPPISKVLNDSQMPVERESFPPPAAPASTFGSFTPNIPPPRKESASIPPPPPVPPPVPSIARIPVPPAIPQTPAVPTPPLPPQMPPPFVPPAPLPPPTPPAPSIPQDSPPSAILSTLSSPQPAPDLGEVLKDIKLPERRAVPGAPSEEIKSKVYDTSLASMLSDDSKKEEVGTEGTQSEAPKPPVGNITSIVAPLRTLKNDFQEIVRDKKISLVKAASLEQDKKRSQEEFQAKKPKNPRTRNILIATILFVVLGASVLIGILIILEQRNGTVSVAEDTSLLFAESSAPLPLDNLTPFDVKSVIAQMRSISGSLGSITRIVPTVRDTAAAATEGVTPSREATLEEFFVSLGTHASPNLVRALGNEFFFGIHTVDKNAPVLIIPVTSYERAFAGMLEWESTMNADLIPAFTSVPATFLGPDGLLERRQFEDVIMRNYDTRALKDNTGAIQLFYSFPTRNVLVIAESPYSFVEILARLRAERRL